MARNIYALLVGIDDYPGAVPKLNGCKNDILAIEALLKQRVSAEGDVLQVKRLLDSEARREAVIAGFENHLAQAGGDDVALFYYSGHGSQEPAPEEWWDIEPDHLDETLVLYDSREPGKWDLADKELAALLGKVAEENPHLLVVLDCCHSGSGTRAGLEDGTAERRAPQDDRTRPLSSFVFAAETVADLTDPVSDRAVLGESGWSLPRASHVLLSGCRSNETSKEIRSGATSRGAMSAALEEVLSASGNQLTYRDVHRAVSANVKTKVRAQHPQLETASAADLDRPFLGGAVTSLPASFVLSNERGAWTIDGGSVHGVAGPVGDEATLLDIRRPDESSVATGKVTAVRTGDSTVVVTEGELEPALSYRAFVTATPMPPVLVVIEGDQEAADSLRVELASREESGPQVVAEVGHGDKPAIRVRASSAGYSLRTEGSERALCPSADTPAQAVHSLEHIARWLRVSSLRNGATGLAADAIAVTLVPDPEPGDDEPWEVDGAYRLTYVDEAGQSVPRHVTVTVTNRLRQPLWVALLDLTDTYGIFTDALASGAVELAAEEVLPIPLEVEVPDGLWQRGITEVTDLLKLVVSTEEFDPRTLQQDDLDVSNDLRDVGVRGGAPRSTLDRLLSRAATRRVRPKSSGEAAADWFTRDLQVVSVRPRPGVAVRDTTPVEVAPGVRVAPHPTLQATLQLTNAPDATRDLDGRSVPAALHDADPFGLLTTRGGDAESDALLVTVDSGALGSVTREEPLVLQLDRELGEDEHVLPFAWDGEFYVPLGFSRHREGGCEVVVERLVAPISTTRSLGGSIRILFRKLVGEKLGRPFEYPLLRLATIDEHGDVEYETKAGAVQAAVAQAESVLLYVHGIIGDTEEMVRSAWMAGAARALADTYDVILAFDYENLHTPIEENARSLGERLDGVGLGAGHGKRFDIVAHSMGGLVSRYLIEFVGGVDIDRLVTLGTPNGGSPWPTVQKWATAGVAFAVNSLTAVAWPVQVLGSVLALVEKVDSALDQMEPGSPFLKNLAEGTDPEVPYHVVIGDRSLVEGAPAKGLLSRLWPGRVVSEVIDLAFLNHPNDLAVAVTSGRSLPAGRTPAVQFHVIASDHVSFFSTPVSLALLAELLAD